MKLNKIQRAMVCSALAISLPVTSITANALTNPATGNGQATIAEDIKNRNNTNNSPKTDYPSNPPESVKNGDLEEAVENCPLEESSNQAIQDAITIATTQPDVDSVFNAATEAAKGCFAASSQVINLADIIPDINVSGIGTATKKAINTIIQNKLTELKDRACAIADEALLSSLEPIKKYMDEYKQRVDEINGLVGNVGNLGGVSSGSSIGIIEDVIDEKIGSTTNRIDQLGEQAAKKQAELQNKVDSEIAQANKKLESEVGNIAQGLPPSLTSGYSNSQDNDKFTAPYGMTGGSQPKSVSRAEPTIKTPPSSSSSSSSSTSKSSGSTSNRNAFASPDELNGKSPF